MSFLFFVSVLVVHVDGVELRFINDAGYGPVARSHDGKSGRIEDRRAAALVFCVFRTPTGIFGLAFCLQAGEGRRWGGKEADPLCISRNLAELMLPVQSTQLSWSSVPTKLVHIFFFFFSIYYCLSPLPSTHPFRQRSVFSPQ